MDVFDPICDYGRTQRVVLLIDLNPLLKSSDPNPYITTVISAAKSLFSFPPLSSSLFSFKLFFSSLSPVLSSSKLPTPSLSLSFNHPAPTFHSLSQTLASIKTQPSSHSPQALHVAASMRQLVHDYGWDPVICDPLSGTVSSDPNCSLVKSNLVVLFSPISSSLNSLSLFLGVEANDECLRSTEGFLKKFRGLFEGVKEAFDSRDIHFSWVDVDYGEREVDLDESELGFGFFEGGIRNLDWGFCSSDSIVLGSAIVPFGLIYPKIGVFSKFAGFTDCRRKLRGQLSLEIVDVSGKPLECKCCELEFVPFNKATGLGVQKQMVLEGFGDGIAKIHVQAIQMHDKCVGFAGSLSDPILVREFSGEGQKTRKGNCSELFEDRVLEILETEMGELVRRKSSPIWQILLSFLCREGYWAVVTLSNGDDNSFRGILKPFTVSSALLSIIEDEHPSPGMTSELSGVGLCQFFKKIDNKMYYQKTDSPSRKYTEHKTIERKKNKKRLSNVNELTWKAFCEAVFEDFKIDLEEVCFSRGCNKSKKLKFLKCWLKQIKKSSHCSLTMPGRSKLDQDIPKEPENRLNDLPQESAQPIASCASVGEDSLTGASRIQDEVALDFHSETSESFFSNLPYKIEQGLESEDLDLESLAARLVNSSVYWLYQKCEKEITSESQTGGIKACDTSASAIFTELTKLLLKDPKDLASKHRNSNPSGHSSDPTSTRLASGNIVREYELQILFRMEILQSEVGSSIGESTKQKFVKQICLLLETIQWHLQGGFLGDWSLEKYIGRIIKNRYEHNLGEVVHRIYEKMDLLLFADEDESPNPLLNSEESSQPWKERPQRDQMGENHRISEPLSAENEHHQSMEENYQRPQGMNQDEHTRKLIEAQERRQRARRFSSFTSWVPDLQRVWAPKQPKAMKVKSDPLRRLSKRKQQKSESYDMVCETPMTGKKHSSRGGGCSSGNKDSQRYGASLCGSVSKALFQGN